MLLNEGHLGAKSLDLSDPFKFETKTITSAVKQYFRDLKNPLTTYNLYRSFIESVKDENDDKKIEKLSAVLTRMPVVNHEMLKILIKHLSKVAAKNHINLMTSANLGLVFGPTLLKHIFMNP